MRSCVRLSVTPTPPCAAWLGSRGLQVQEVACPKLLAICKLFSGAGPGLAENAAECFGGGLRDGRLLKLAEGAGCTLGQAGPKQKREKERERDEKLFFLSSKLSIFL